MDAQTSQVVTLVIAIVGAVLGVLNTWRAFGQDRMRLKLKPQHILLTDGTHCLGLHIINLSGFDVTITHTGFNLHGTQRHMQFMPIFQGGGQLPILLKPRTSQTAILRPGAEQAENFTLVERAYVKTACGNTVSVTNAVLRDFVYNVTQTRMRQSFNDGD